MAISTKPANPSAAKLKRPEPSESAVLGAIRLALQIHPAVAWAERINGDAHSSGEGATRRFIRYVFKGCPDIIWQRVNGRALYIEVKKPSGRVSVEQAEFLARASRFSACAFVARSVADVFSELDKTLERFA